MSLHVEKTSSSLERFLLSSNDALHYFGRSVRGLPRQAIVQAKFGQAFIVSKFVYENRAVFEFFVHHSCVTRVYNGACFVCISDQDCRVYIFAGKLKVVG